MKIYYMNTDFEDGWDKLSFDERHEAQKADVIISKDGKVMKDRYDGRRFQD